MILLSIEVIWCLTNYLCLKKNFTKITVGDQFQFFVFCYILGVCNYHGRQHVLMLI